MHRESRLSVSWGGVLKDDLKANGTIRPSFVQEAMESYNAGKPDPEVVELIQDVAGIIFGGASDALSIDTVVSHHLSWG